MIQTRHMMLAGVLGLLAAGCAEDYSFEYPVPEMPYDVELAQRLSSYDLLTGYLGDGSMKLGTTVTADCFTEQGLEYSIIHNNFNQIDAYGSMYPADLFDEETGAYDFGNWKSINEAAAKDGVDLFGTALCSRSNFPSKYIKNLLADIVIPYQPWNEIIDIADFEGEVVGTKHASNKKAAGSAPVEIAEDAEHGKVLKGTKLTMDLPMIGEIKLPAGSKLKDVSRVILNCYLEAGTPTGSRIVVENAGYTEKGNPHSTKNQWVEYIFDMSNIKLTDAQKELTTFKLYAGAYGSSVTCMVDDVRFRLEHNDGDDTVIVKSDEEKAAIVQGELDKWVDGVLDNLSDAVGDMVIYDEPLDDEFATWDWAEYLGDGYLKAIQARAAGKGAYRWFVSQTVKIDELTSNDITTLHTQLSEMENKGIKVDAVNIELGATYSLDYPTQLKNDANAEAAMQALKTLDKPVRVSNFCVRVVDQTGAAVSPEKLTANQRMAAAEYYQKVLSAYRSALGHNAIGFSISCVRDCGTNVGPWTCGGDRNFIYEGLVKGLTE